MKPYFEDDGVQLYLGDCREILAGMADESVDAVVCDPPYEIGIAGRGWDSSGIAYDTAMWRECLRVLKPGGHLLAFGAPRTYHRMACAVEDAGFHVIDQLDWIYIHGKPKGVDLARAIDRRRDDRDETLQVTAWLKTARDAAGWDNARLNAVFGFHPSGQAGHWMTQGVAACVPTVEQWQKLREVLGFDDTEILPIVERLWVRKGTVGEAFHHREVISERREAARDTGLYGSYSGHRVKSLPYSSAARQWAGWNTALKPAHDPILLARKSTGFDSLTAGLLRHGVGGLNVTGCPADGGGWPTNILLGHDCEPGMCHPECPVRGMGVAAKSFPVFRLESRTPDAERATVNGITHPTPKPVALMRWLTRLVTPPSGLVLDPFAGSGATLEAAAAEGFQAIGVEQEPDYLPLIMSRLSKPVQTGLFGVPS